MGYLEGFILGIIQGLTEFLPVSSSGHLVIFQDFLRVRQPGITFEVMVHFGTLLSVIWVFGRDIRRVLTRFWRHRQERRFGLMLVLGVVPTGLMGVLGGNIFERFYESTLTTGAMLLVTGLIIYSLSRIRPGDQTEKNMKPVSALLISVAQGIAIIPGISRSGSTITAALWCGLDRETAVRFSFLISIPVILGATLLEIRELSAAGFADLGGGVVLGTIAAFLTGVCAIKIFIRALNAGRFHYFAYYCWFAGILTISLKLGGL